MSVTSCARSPDSRSVFATYLPHATQVTGIDAYYRHLRPVVNKSGAPTTSSIPMIHSHYNKFPEPELKLECCSAVNSVKPWPMYASYHHTYLYTYLGTAELTAKT